MRDSRSPMPLTALHAATMVVTSLATGLAPLERLGPKPRGFGEIATAHQTVFAALASGVDGDDVTAVLNAFDDIAARPSGDDVEVAPADYPELFAAAIEIGRASCRE